MATKRCSHAVRVLRLREMFERQPFVTVAEVQQRFGVSRKTVYNDLAALQEAEVPIEATLAEDGQAHWTMQRAAKKSGLTLGGGQVVPLGLARLALSFLDGTDLYEQLGILQQKLAEGATAQTRRHLEELRRKVTLVPHGPKLYRAKDDVLNALLTALLRDDRVAVRYLAAGASGKPRAHVLEPLTLVLYREALYLIAATAKGSRLCFAVDRITRATWRKGDRFEYPTDHDPASYFDGSFGLLGGSPTRVELLFEEAQARYVKERRWHPTQRFEELGDGRVRMTMDVSGTQDVLLWLMGHAGTFEVVEPAALRAAVRKRAKETVGANG